MESEKVRGLEDTKSVVIQEVMTSNGNGFIKDHWTQRLCVLGVVLTLHVSLVGLIVISFMGREPPPALAGIAGVSLGALANAMMPSRRP